MKPLKPLEIDLEKTTLIEAGAGTGKTYTITTMVVRLIAAGYSLETILVVTFTEAAAAELKLRIRQRLHQTLKKLEQDAMEDDDDLVRFLRGWDEVPAVKKRLALALADFDMAPVMTIHSFCLKVLREHSFESSSYFDMELVPDRSSFLRQAAYDFFMIRTTGMDPLFLNYMDMVSVTPEIFISAFEKVLARPDLVLNPPAGNWVDFFDEYRGELQALCRTLTTQTQADEIARLIADHEGLDKRSYSKKNVPSWLGAAKKALGSCGENAIFNMTEKGDALYKFTRSRIEEKTKPGFNPPSHPFFDLCERLLEFSEIFHGNLIALKHEFIVFLKEQLEKTKIEQGILFFDDLINDLSRVLDGAHSKNLKEAVRKDFKACLIDEFQDTDPRQYSIFARLFEGEQTPFFMIGDPKQAIYAFRGGDIFAYLNAARNSRQRFTLETNYRSSPLLVSGINKLFSLALDPFDHEDISFFPLSTPAHAIDRLNDEVGSPEPPLTFCFLPRDNVPIDRQGRIPKKTADEIIPGVVANEMVSLLNSNMCLAQSDGDDARPVNPADIAVLVRTNSQAEEIRKALASRNIPAYISKTSSVYDSEQALEMYDILCAVWEPSNTALVKGALASGVFQMNAGDIRKLDEDEDQYFFWHEFFAECRSVWGKQGFVAMIMKILHCDAALLSPENRMSERNLTNIYHLIELLADTAQRTRLTPYYLLKWYAEQLVESRRQAAQDELRLESDKKAVAIVTIHKSKGLEYPVVYLPYLWEGQRRVSGPDIYFHDPMQDDRLTLDLGSNDMDRAVAAYEKEDRAEQMRLLYVALTRASAMCNIIWGGFSPAESSSLGRLLHSTGACATDAAMLDDISTLNAAAPGSVVCRMLNTDIGKIKWNPAIETEESLAARTVHRQITPQFRTASFSSIVQHAAHPEIFPAQKPVDPDSGSIIELETFPKGASAGDFFHAVLEHLDFRQEKNNIEQMVDTFAPQFGFNDKALKQMSCKALTRVIKTRLSPSKDGFSLDRIRLADRLNEMAFTLPVTGLSGKRLEKVFNASTHPYIKSAGYPRLVGEMAREALKGYLKGFIDLVVRYNDRYYIIDYKSNYLGSTYESYNPDQMHPAMAGHHYFLQYHLYLLALHRYLSHRLKGYDYRRHIGGVFYLFLRGMQAEPGSKTGTFYDLPDFEMVEMLSGAFK